MKRRRTGLLILLTLLIVKISFSQQQKIDSLNKVLLTVKDDTSKISTLSALSWELKAMGPDTSISLTNQILKMISTSRQAPAPWKEFATAKCWQQLGSFHYMKSEFKTALEYYSRALAVWEKLGNTVPADQVPTIKNRLSSTLGNIGIVYGNQGEYQSALNYYFKALKIDEELGDKTGIARHLSNIGLAYADHADYTKAIDFYLRSLKINEETGNKAAVATNLSNIGIVYMDQGDYKKALTHYQQSLKIKEEIGNKSGVALTLGNIGGVYRDQGDYDKAMEYYSDALKINEAMGNKRGIANQLSNIGNIYSLRGDYEKALDHYFSSLKIDSEIENTHAIAITYGNIGASYLEQKKYAEAEKYLTKSLAIAETYHNQAILRDNHYNMSRLDSSRSNFKGALLHYKLYVAYRDSIANEENTRDQTRSEMQYEFDKKEAATKADQEKKNAVTAAEKRKQEIVLWSVVSGLILLLVFSAVIFKSYREKKKANFEILVQKEIIEQKQKEILDSIHYAKRIQMTLLTSEKYIARKINDLKKKI